MAEVTIPKEKMNYTIDLLITMVTDEIAEETGKDRKEILTDFLCSKTGKALYDENTKLWCNGPAYIAELYREELRNPDIRFEMNAYPDGVENFRYYIVVTTKYFKSY